MVNTQACLLSGNAKPIGPKAIRNRLKKHIIDILTSVETDGQFAVDRIGNRIYLVRRYWQDSIDMNDAQVLEFAYRVGDRVLLGIGQDDSVHFDREEHCKRIEFSAIRLECMGVSPFDFKIGTLLEFVTCPPVHSSPMDVDKF